MADAGAAFKARKFCLAPQGEGRAGETGQPRCLASHALRISSLARAAK